MKAQVVAPVAVVERARDWPAARFAVPLAAAPVMVTAGNGVMAKLEPVGQDWMKPAARVKTERIPSGVSKADGMAADFEAVLMKV